jgi:hypothetical protein
MLVFVTGATGRTVDVLRAFGFVRDTAPYPQGYWRGFPT